MKGRGGASSSAASTFASTFGRAFVLRVAAYGESDAVVTLLTEREGVVPALARRARAPSSRQGIVLEPFHTLSVQLSQGSGDLSKLRSSTMEHARARLVGDGYAIDAAGAATRWVRALAPVRTPEPEVFVALARLLDDIDMKVGEVGGTGGVGVFDALLASFGLELLAILGYGLELERCARCGRPKPPHRAAYVIAVGGGVVCEACCRHGHDPAIRDARSAVPSADDTLFAGPVVDAMAANDAALRALPAPVAARVLRLVVETVELHARTLGHARPTL